MCTVLCRLPSLFLLPLTYHTHAHTHTDTHRQTPIYTACASCCLHRCCACFTHAASLCLRADSLLPAQGPGRSSGRGLRCRRDDEHRERQDQESGDQRLHARLLPCAPAETMIAPLPISIYPPAAALHVRGHTSARPKTQARPTCTQSAIANPRRRVVSGRVRKSHRTAAVLELGMSSLTFDQISLL